MLESKIQSLIAELENEHKYHLANVISNNWNKTILEYSQNLYTYKPVISVEKELEAAIKKTALVYGHTQDEVNSIYKSFEQYRTVQTAHHADIVNTPRMLLINYLASRGLPQDAWYLVFAFSGIPFTNASRPGCIKWSKHELSDVIDTTSPLYSKIKNDFINAQKDKPSELMRLSLFPAKEQDEIVYQSTITDKLTQTIASLHERLKVHFTKPEMTDYTTYALTTCRNIESKILGIQKSAYLDINTIAKEYLLLILQKDNHIVLDILFNPAVRSKIASSIETEAIFYKTFQDKNGKTRQESIFLRDDGYHANKTTINWTKQGIIDELQNGRLCPGLFLTYFIFKFINGVRCLGSFVAAEYLPVYKEKLLASGIMDNHLLKTVPTDNLTTGMLPNKELEQITAIDILLGSAWEPDENMLYGELLTTLMTVIYGRDFTK